MDYVTSPSGREPTEDVLTEEAKLGTFSSLQPELFPASSPGGLLLKLMLCWALSMFGRRQKQGSVSGRGKTWLSLLPLTCEWHHGSL